MVSERLAHTAAFNLGFFVGVGSRGETDALHGASHMLEHVLFKGTERLSAEQISASIEAVGGDLNAYTAKEHTCFYARLLAEDSPRAIEVMSDMLAHSLIRPQHFRSERTVVLEEIAMGNDDPGDVAHDITARRLYGPSGLARPVIGSVDSIRAMERDTVVDYWRSRYRADDIVVSASGAVDHDQLLEALAPLDQALSARRPPLEAAVGGAPAVAEPGVFVATRDFEQLEVVMSWPGPALLDPRRSALDVLVTVLGGGMSARLFVEVRESRGLAYTIDASEIAYTDAGQVSIEWACAPSRLQPIIDVVRSVLDDVVAHGITEEELARAKGQIRGQTLLGLESPASHMSRNGRTWLQDDPRSVADIMAEVAAVTREDVHALAAELFTGRPTLAVVGPWQEHTPVSLG
ncbi:Predicted Zn-dependent peptidase [Raineyella antarctica]|uniref:Predicted Zn-dependent peptidase n=1 Tax=Raineyella antarctica TaxID=1577474 RepID=A0A1G6HB00_9ACTN|nr:pitrilysin family protein [Raineyella antarctica]SDB91333.1 Predicted Zn-dependent peptidase [Raineyella antarctica]